VLVVRNTIMYSVVAAILVVASFGIYNTLSTIVMEKTRDIAILKSMVFTRVTCGHLLLEGIIHRRDRERIRAGSGIWAHEGAIDGPTEAAGRLGKSILPIWWGPETIRPGHAFALVSCILAAYLPARRAGRVHPVEIIAGRRMTAVLRAETIGTYATRRGAGGPWSTM